MRFPRRHGERGRVRQDLGALIAQAGGGGGEAEIEADEGAEEAEGGREGAQEGGAGLGAGAFADGGRGREGHVEEVEFVVVVGYFARGGDPDEGVLGALARGGGFVDADADGEVVYEGGALEAEDEGAGVEGLGEGDCFGGGGGDVVACFGEEEGLGGL